MRAGRLATAIAAAVVAAPGLVGGSAGPAPPAAGGPRDALVTAAGAYLELEAPCRRVLAAVTPPPAATAAPAPSPPSPRPAG